MCDNHPCPSQLFVLSEIIDKFACACQAVIMMKMLGNLVLFIWSKFKVTSNLAAENLALRQQLAVMKRTNKRPKIRMADRLFWVLLFRIWTPWRKSLVIVRRDTVVLWHRKGFKLFWKFKSNTPQGGISASKAPLRSLSGEHFKFLILMRSPDFIFYESKS